MSSSPELHRSPRLAAFQAARVYRPEEHLSPKADCHNWCLTTSLTSGEAMNSTLAMIIRGRLAFKAVSISSGLTYRMRDIRIFSIGWMTATYQMSSKSVDAVLVAVAHELLGNGGQRTDDNNCRACESQI